MDLKIERKNVSTGELSADQISLDTYFTPHDKGELQIQSYFDKCFRGLLAEIRRRFIQAWHDHCCKADFSSRFAKVCEINN